MGSKSLDSEVLAALHLMSKSGIRGVRYVEFVRQNILNGAIDLLNRGYAQKITQVEDNDSYRLTPNGIEYLEKILRYASEQF